VTAWEMVIGLEVHCELATRTKMFCACVNEFGAEPNTNVCPVCLGLPGSLPVINERAVEFALRVGTALQCSVPPSSIFHRKNYFYPDMPKNYQISQYDEPICVEGRLDVDGARIGVLRAHLEEDTGKTAHIGGGGRIHEAEYSLVDYNRAGVPLLEIVSHPDIRSADQARAYVSELRAVLEAIGVSDVKMEEGSLRVDANISMRPAGSPEGQYGTKVEIKNMNSLRSLVRALEYERGRQIAVLESGESVVQETRHWNEAAGRTEGMRSKEEAFDYRYFPEPDLVPVAPPEEWKARVREALPELPAARRARLATEWGVSEHDAAVLVGTPGLADFASAAVTAGAPARDVVVWCTGEILRFINEGGTIAASGAALAELIALVRDGTISTLQAKTIVDEILAGRPAREVVAERGLAQVSDESALAPAIDKILAGHPDEVARWRGGDDKERKKLKGFFMGLVMKELKGQGNPQVLTRLLEERLG
jgi:aspartyl-tRNA(Asn)/glutamyl-tRNA(Gln) amidotransferase subunit B